jgi:hypothetical protein
MKTLNMIRKTLRFISYVIILFLGFLGATWLIWSRFIRERTIRDIPDLLLTEYRFWILLYICFIYIYIIKSFLKVKEISTFSNLIVRLVKIIYKPLITLDKTIKYNLLENIYYDFSLFITSRMSIKSRYKPFIISIFQVIPRAIMVLFLLADTFYFHKLATFYNVILLGIFPLIYRYLKYSINEIYEHYIELLEEKYEKVRIYEKEYKEQYGGYFDDKDISKSAAEHHNKKVTIKEYIEIKFEADVERSCNITNICYEAEPYVKKEIEELFKMIKYETQDKKKRLSLKDYEEIDKLFYNLIYHILNIKVFLEDLAAWENDRKIRYIKAFIFSLYFICWSYILYVSYKANPVELITFKNFLLDFAIKLNKYDNPF